jgi:hypothetical protein
MEIKIRIFVETGSMLTQPAGHCGKQGGAFNCLHANFA